MPNFETRLKDVSHAAWLIWTANGRRPKRNSMIGSLTSGAIFSAIWCKRSTLLKKRKSRDRPKTQCEAPYGRAENRFSRFFLLCAVTGRANLGHRATCRGVFARSTRFLHLLETRHVGRRQRTLLS